MSKQSPFIETKPPKAKPANPFEQETDSFNEHHLEGRDSLKHLETIIQNYVSDRRRKMRRGMIDSTAATKDIEKAVKLFTKVGKLL